MYHRVCELETDPWELCVAPARFAEQMEVLREAYAPVSLDRLIAGLERGRVPRRAVAVTFDDGYADVLHGAAPLLERHGVPGTAFLVSRHLGAGREFWWDELEAILLRPGVLPPELALRVAGVEHRWHLGEHAAYDEAAFARNRWWTPWAEPHPTPRHAAYREIWELLQRRPDEERRAALDTLRAWAGVAPADRPAYRTLAPDEVASLCASGLVDVGAHTTSHSALAALAPDAQRREIRESRRDLEEMAGRAVTTFAYPYGRKCDYTDESVALVREAGFAGACSNFDGLVDRDTGRYELPRIHVGNWNGDEFGRQLAAIFGED
jgi:peptidoglycan/xylan/chitin deacetylase (PgdA/CDA1 family)